MIDLHSHTDQSDGTFTPTELVDHALEIGLEALAITDHDNFEGYRQVREYAAERGLELVCGIEVSSRSEWQRGSIHVLGYFPEGPAAGFCEWLEEIQVGREERNAKLAERLQEAGLDVTLEEAQAMGRNMTGRPHFARVMMRKGYVGSIEEAFARYLGENGSAHVPREEPKVSEVVGRIREAGGLPSLAHPVRLPFGRDLEMLDRVIGYLAGRGLSAVEIIHSDHTVQDTNAYQALARKYGLQVTGGSDFHGANKPNVHLGTGRNGNVQVPKSFLLDLVQSYKA